jgi:hypothetical protein
MNDYYTVSFSVQNPVVHVNKIGKMVVISSADFRINIYINTSSSSKEKKHHEAIKELGHQLIDAAGEVEQLVLQQNNTVEMDG